MAMENSYNFRRVSQELTTSGVVGEERLRGLAAEAYAVLVNLLPDDSDHAVSGEQAIVEEQGLRYVHIPVDFARPAIEDYDRFATVLDQAHGQKTHLHCAANYRVSAFYALYAESAGLWDRAQADAFIEDLWQPAAHPGWPELLAAVRQRDLGA